MLSKAAPIKPVPYRSGSTLSGSSLASGDAGSGGSGNDSARLLRTLTSGLQRKRSTCVNASRLFWRIEAAKNGLTTATASEVRSPLVSPELREAVRSTTHANARASAIAFYRSVFAAIQFAAPITHHNLKALIAQEGLTAAFVRIRACIDLWPSLLTEHHAFTRDHRSTALPSVVPRLSYFYRLCFEALESFGASLVTAFRTATAGFDHHTTLIAPGSTIMPIAVAAGGGATAATPKVHRDSLREVLQLLSPLMSAQHTLNRFRQRIFTCTEPVPGTTYVWSELRSLARLC